MKLRRYLFGLLIVATVSCGNLSGGKKSVETAHNETVLQEPMPAEHKKKEMQQPPIKPILLSEVQYIQLVADFRTSDKKYKGEKPCVVDFYADWCRPCRMMSPIFEKLAGKYGDKVNFYKVDADVSPNISAAYNITALPTLFFIDSKGVTNKIMGFMSEEEMEKAILTIIE